MAEPICWYEHEAWDEGEVLRLGKEHHLYHTCLPMPSFLLSERRSLQGSPPTPVGAGCLAGHRWFCRQGLELGAGEDTCHPPSPPSATGSRNMAQKRGGGLFSEVLSFLRSRTLCQVGPRVIRRALLVGARTEHLTRPVHTAPPAPLLCLRLERGEKTGH